MSNSFQSIAPWQKNCGAHSGRGGLGYMCFVDIIEMAGLRLGYLDEEHAPLCCWIMHLREVRAEAKQVDRWVYSAV
jgi:hypothetical protein